MGYGGAGASFSGNATGNRNNISGKLGATVSSADVWLKELYLEGGSLNSLLYDDPVLKQFEELPASGQIDGGRHMVVPTLIDYSPNQSKNFTKAQNSAKERTGARGRWTVPTDDDYGVARIENKLIKATKNDMGSFFRELTTEVDQAILGLRYKKMFRSIQSRMEK